MRFTPAPPPCPEFNEVNGSMQSTVDFPHILALEADHWEVNATGLDYLENILSVGIMNESCFVL